MSLYVIIEKVYENEKQVVYNFGPSPNSFEKLVINKETGEINRLETSVNNPNYYYLKAVAKLNRHIKSNPSDQYPDKLIYAS